MSKRPYNEKYLQLTLVDFIQTGNNVQPDVRKVVCQLLQKRRQQIFHRAVHNKWCDLFLLSLCGTYGICPTINASPLTSFARAARAC